MGVDLVLDQQLLGLAAADVGLELVVRDHDLDRPAVDAAGLVDAVDRHLQADQRGLAAGGGRARQRLQRADLVGLGLAEGRLPRRRHQHGRAERARRYAVADHAAARHLAAIPKVVRCVVSHGEFLLRSARTNTAVVATSGSAKAWFVAVTFAGRRKSIELIANCGSRRKNPSVSPKDRGMPCHHQTSFNQVCPIIHVGKGVPTTPAARRNSPAAAFAHCPGDGQSRRWRCRIERDN